MGVVLCNICMTLIGEGKRRERGRGKGGKVG